MSAIDLHVFLLHFFGAASHERQMSRCLYREFLREMLQSQAQNPWKTHVVITRRIRYMALLMILR